MSEKERVVETCPVIVSNNLLLNETISTNHNYIIVNCIAYVIKRFSTIASHPKYVLNFFYTIEKLLKIKEI
ncbi:MAG: hypothetical protein ACMUIP_15285 [bacterium]